MIQSRSISRELALLVLGQIPENHVENLESLPMEGLLNKAIEGLIQHCREELDSSAEKLETAHQHLMQTELQDLDKNSSNYHLPGINVPHYAQRDTWLQSYPITLRSEFLSFLNLFLF